MRVSVGAGMGVSVHVYVAMFVVIWRLLPRFHEQVIALGVDKPVDSKLFSTGPTATAASKKMRWWRVDSQCEQSWRLGKVGYEPVVTNEIDEDNDVHQENKEEDDNPGFGGSVDTPRCVLLRFKGRVEGLRHRCVEKRLFMILGPMLELKIK